MALNPCVKEYIPKKKYVSKKEHVPKIKYILKRNECDKPIKNDNCDKIHNNKSDDKIDIDWNELNYELSIKNLEQNYFHEKYILDLILVKKHNYNVYYSNLNLLNKNYTILKENINNFYHKK